MPVNDQTTGRDCTVDVYDPRTGGMLTLPGLKSFAPKPLTKNDMRARINGKHKPFLISTGWEGTLSLDREDDTVDAWWAAWEAAYHAGENMRLGTIRQTIKEANGSVSQYRFEEVALRLDDAGTYAGDDVTEISLSWQASTRTRVG